jgi:hypothetical protein
MVLQSVDKPDDYESQDFIECPWKAPAWSESYKFGKLQEDAAKREWIKKLVINDLNEWVSSTIWWLKAQEIEDEKQADIMRKYIVRYNQLKNEWTILSETALQKRAMDLAKLDSESWTVFIWWNSLKWSTDVISGWSVLDKWSSVFIQQKPLDWWADVAIDDSVYEVAQW